jgi:hypothetical protein
LLNISEDRKMRLELAGSFVRPEPLIVSYFYNPIITEIFDTNKYIAMGYTHFEVICIGGGGGQGGGIDTGGAGTRVRNFGGAGGGGGFQRVHGVLSALPNTCEITVGKGGNIGTQHVSDPGLTTDGEDGGHSAFNIDTCQASGGKGGKRAQSNSITVTTQADGGEGGVGNRIVAGGGAAGGTAGTPGPAGGTPGTNGIDGILFQNIGEGGGGGAGGVSEYIAGNPIHNAATAGGRGSYNPGDVSVYGPGDLPGVNLGEEFDGAIPGAAGGAKAAPLNGLPTVYGSSADRRIQSNHGVIIIRLTVK